jgi:TonB family protein
MLIWSDIHYVMQKKRFLKLPEYPGGKEELRKYVNENLKYPEEALKKKIEGFVLLTAQIDDNGEVLSVSVDKGIGYGCDEEAIRLIEGLHFGGVKNRGMRLTTKKKFKIRFKLKNVLQKNSSAEQTIKYNYKTETKSEEKTPPKTVYSYTVNINKS